MKYAVSYDINLSLLKHILKLWLRFNIQAYLSNSNVWVNQDRAKPFTNVKGRNNIIHKVKINLYTVNCAYSVLTLCFGR